MINYTTKDIVVRAKQLADLENSDFISWNENINLLNESWQKIYQDLIDNGDKTFIKEMEVESKVMELPNDFYELFSVELVPSCIQITRKAKSETEHTLSYDIENNKFILYGNPSGKVRIKYFPNPQTLTLQNTTKDINDDLLNDTTFIDCYKNQYFYIKNGKGYIYNINTKESVEITNLFEIVGNISSGIIGKRHGWVVADTTTDDTNDLIQCYGGIPQPIDRTSGDKACFLRDGEDVGYLFKSNNNHININIVGKNGFSIDLNNRITTDDTPISFNLLHLGMGSFKRYSDNHYVLTLPTVITNTPYPNTYDYIQLDIYTENENLYVEESYPYSDYNFSENNMYINYINDDLCINDNNGFYINENQIFSADDYTFVGVNELNDNNGYGITVKDTYNTNHYMLHSFFTDTFLNYPNNIFFNFISILMAMSYKIKQGGNVDMLGMKLSEMENQYFDTLSRDVNNVVRITNVY